jgi:diaminopimelate epimerase
MIMGALANRDFVKMNGLGNEIVVVDLRHVDLRHLDLRHAPGPIAADEARAAAGREFYDQLMVLYPPHGATDAAIRIYNNDGSEAGACGNGMRCVASLVSAETGKAALAFETPAGLVACWSAGNGLFTVDMGVPRFRWDEIPLAHEVADTRALDLDFGPPGAPILRAPSALSMGNPHVIFWVEDVEAYNLRTIGPQLEHYDLFPDRANITLAATPSRDHVVIRTWERGAGLTKACGSAACASAVAAARLNRTGRKVTVTLPGGDLAIEWREADDHVLMTGPVEYEHKGRFEAALFADLGAE